MKRAGEFSFSINNNNTNTQPTDTTMKTKTCSIIGLTLLSLCAGALAQDGGGIGVGVGVGIGVGTGIGANIEVERVPGNVVQGRRVFAAKLVAGSQSTTNQFYGPLGSGVGGIPRGWGAGFAISSAIQTREYSTTVSIFNPGTNTVTFNYNSSGGVFVGGSPLTLGPRSSTSIGTGGWVGPMTVGFVAIESQVPLEVVALYQYRDERVDFSKETWIETAAGSLFGPGF